MPVAPEAVWAALADPAGYGHWVVGSKRIRDADAGWPAPGTRFHHVVGVGPLELRDHTESLAAEAPRLLRMRAHARPLGAAIVELRLEPRGTGTLVRMREHPDTTVGRVLLGNPLGDRLIELRNARSLARLQQLALRASARPAAPR
jgi:uncharacterized protein YndB with AHSA1/START domain